MSDLFVVRVWDGFDEIWLDETNEPLSKEKAEELWNKITDHGKKNTRFDDITYYKIFPADSTMLFSDSNHWN